MNSFCFTSTCDDRLLLAESLPKRGISDKYLHFLCKMNSLKSWPNGLARQRKSTQVAFRLAIPLALTCDDLCWLWLSSNSYARHRLIANQLYICAWNLRPFATCVSVWPAIASSCASSGFTKLRRLASTCESVWTELKATCCIQTLLYLPLDVCGRKSFFLWPTRFFGILPKHEWKRKL